MAASVLFRALPGCYGKLAVQGGGCAGPRGVKKIAAVAVGQRLQLSRGGGSGWVRLGLGLGVAGDGGCRQAEAALGVGAFAAGGQQVGGGGQAQCGL